jgi:ethanolamine utilization microcompartment shell protein EutL
MSELFIEVAPGNEIFRCADVALKAADVRPALQIVEREFGLLEVHSRTQAEVIAAGQAVLEYLGIGEADRLKPKVASSQFVTNVNPYQAQLINRWRKGNLLLPRSSLFVLEVSPAAYVTLAANEAEKTAEISLIEVRAVGRFGRLFVSGSESDVRTARDAAVAALAALEGRE